MTVTASDLGLYAFALLILVLTPGPVWVAIAARAMSGGMASAVPLALGVVAGDILWPLFAIFGISLIASVYADFLTVLRYAAAVIFVLMGIGLLRHTGEMKDGAASALTRPGKWAGFVAGVLVILSNPKAVLFYMGILPGFFDMSSLTRLDIIAICTLSAIVPLAGNMALALTVDRARHLLTSPAAVKRLTAMSGLMLIAVGIIISFT